MQGSDLSATFNVTKIIVVIVDGLLVEKIPGMPSVMPWQR